MQFLLMAIHIRCIARLHHRSHQNYCIRHRPQDRPQDGRPH